MTGSCALYDNKAEGNDINSGTFQFGKLKEMYETAERFV